MKKFNAIFINHNNVRKNSEDDGILVWDAAEFYSIFSNCKLIRLTDPSPPKAMERTSTYNLEVVLDSGPYRLISDYYGDAKAARSQVPLMNHINEGLLVLEYLGAGVEAMCAYCLHPLLQGDDVFAKSIRKNSILSGATTYQLILATEYRSVANEFLSSKLNICDSPTIRLSPVEEVNLMLIADKVQNRKDFITYHTNSHPRSKLLDKYFKLWLEALGISEDAYQEITKYIDAYKHLIPPV